MGVTSRNTVAVIYRHHIAVRSAPFCRNNSSGETTRTGVPAAAAMSRLRMPIAPVSAGRAESRGNSPTDGNFCLSQNDLFTNIGENRPLFPGQSLDFPQVPQLWKIPHFLPSYRFDLVLHGWFVLRRRFFREKFLWWFRKLRVSSSTYSICASISSVLVYS